MIFYGKIGELVPTVLLANNSKPSSVASSPLVVYQSGYIANNSNSGAKSNVGLTVIADNTLP